MRLPPMVVMLIDPAAAHGLKCVSAWCRSGGIIPKTWGVPRAGSAGRVHLETATTTTIPGKNRVALMRMRAMAKLRETIMSHQGRVPQSWKNSNKLTWVWHCHDSNPIALEYKMKGTVYHKHLDYFCCHPEMIAKDCKVRIWKGDSSVISVIFLKVKSEPSNLSAKYI